MYKFLVSKKKFWAIKQKDHSSWMSFTKIFSFSCSHRKCSNLGSASDTAPGQIAMQPTNKEYEKDAILVLLPR